jgi:hypothetical protein
MATSRKLPASLTRFARLCHLRPPEHGRGHVFAPLPAVGDGQPPGGRRLHRAHAHVDRARLQPGQETSLAEDDGVHRLIVGQHGDHDPGALGRFGRRGGHAGPVGGQRLGPGARAVVHGQGKSGGQEVAGHREPHVAETDHRHRILHVDQSARSLAM